MSIIRNPAPEFSKGIPEADFYQVCDEYNVYSWSPEPPGSRNVKSTQVHLHLQIGGGRVVMRFKSKRAVDELITVLREHRNDVWGDGE
jgi:hypothetical protein